MKFFGALGAGYALLSVFSTVAHGQGMPACAGLCLESSLKGQTTCGPTDIPCICSNAPLNAAIQGCVLSTCTIKEALTAQNATMAMCGAKERDITHITPIVTGVSGGAAGIAVVIRTIAARGELAFDDWFAIAAYIAALPMGILEFFMSADGFGKDIWTIPHPQIYRIIQFTWLTEVFYFIAVALTKVSFLFFCLRIFPRQQMRQAIFVLMAIIIAQGIAFTIACLFNCTPVSFIWEGWDGLHKGKCINFHVFAWAHAGINIVLDVITIAVPIPELLRLSLSLKRKIYIIMMFLVGTFTTVISIVRLQSLVQFSTSTNATWDNVPTAYWSVLEAFVGIFCVCMPALRRFLAGVFPRCFGSTQNNSKYDNFDNTPNEPNRPSGKGTGGKGSKGSMGTFAAYGSAGAGITKTMETTVETEDDEIMLVEMERMRNQGQGGWAKDTDSETSRPEAQSKYPY